MAAELRRRQAWVAALVAVAACVAVFQLPLLAPLRWPLLWFATVVHELGHGLAALALGGHLDRLSLHADGSGVAEYRGAFGDGQVALVAAAGLLAPPLCSMVLLLAGRGRRTGHAALAGLGLALLAAGLAWGGNVLTVSFCTVFGLLLIGVAMAGRAAWSQVLCLFLALELGLASLSRADYLFTAEAATASGTMLSDVGQIAAAGGLPFWFWGALIALAGLTLLGVGLLRFMAALR